MLLLLDNSGTNGRLLLSLFLSGKGALLFGDALIKSVWGLAILFSIVVAFFLAMHARIWWIPWAIPIACAIIYAEAYFSERAKTSGDPQEELIAIVGLAAVAMTAIAVLLGRWAGRSRRGKQRAASSEHDSPD